MRNITWSLTSGMLIITMLACESKHSTNTQSTSQASTPPSTQAQAVELDGVQPEPTQPLQAKLTDVASSLGGKPSSVAQVKDSMTLLASYHRNRHWAEQRGADNIRIRGKVELVRFEDGTLTLKDRGSNRDFVMRSQPHSTRTELRSWLLSWRGTWTQKDDTLTLRLILNTQDSKCEDSLQHDEHTPEVKRCEPLPPSTAEVSCTLKDVEIKGAQVKGWVCDQKQVRALLGTSSPWLFSPEQCIQRGRSGRGKGRVSYRACDKDFPEIE